jgi:membrane protein DedA with SNARE-associated domain
MGTEFIIEHIQWGVVNAAVWGLIFVFILMTIESSFIPFPSEVIMIPAGFLAYRGELTFGTPGLDLLAVVFCGLAGSMAGALFNYHFALLLGRPFLYRFGKYFFVKPRVLSRAEEIFLQYGEITTFVCRLLPGIRQLISLPAGISRMPLPRFALFTALGAGIWSAILAWVGYYLGNLSREMTYVQIVISGKEVLKKYYLWIILFLLILILVYSLVHHYVMKPRGTEAVRHKAD